MSLRDLNLVHEYDGGGSSSKVAEEATIDYSNCTFREVHGKYGTSNVRKGIIRNITRTNTLNSATVVLTHVEEIENMHVYDLIELTNEFGNKEYWTISDFTPSYVTYDAPYKFDYTINLVEPTVYLEHITLPNMTITNIGQNRSIYFYLEKIIAYFQNGYGEVVLNGQLKTVLNLSNITCPECTFQSPTMKEYINYLLSFVDGAPYCKLEYSGQLKRFDLFFKDPNPTRDFPLDTKHILSLTQTQSASEYASIINNESSDIINKNTIREYQMLKSDDSIFNSTTAKLILSHKVYDIKKLSVVRLNLTLRGWGCQLRSKMFSQSGTQSGLKTPSDSDYPDYTFSVEGSAYPNEKRSTNVNIYFNTTGGVSNTDWVNTMRRVGLIDVDITDYVVKNEIYSTLEMLKTGEYNYATNYNTNYKNNSLRWSRGSKEIDNLNFYQSSKIVWWDKLDSTAIEYAIRSAIVKNIDSILDPLKYYFDIEEEGVWRRYLVKYFFVPQQDSDEISFTYDWKDIKFEIEYVPYTNVRMKIARKEYEHSIEANDSNTNASTDIKSYVQKTKNVVKSLGNKSLIFTARSPNDRLYYSLGMMFDNYVLNDMEYTVKNNSIVYKGILTKDYSNQDINTAINREKRYYSLPDALEAVLRNEIQKYNIRMSITEVYPSTPNTSMGYLLKKEMNYCRFYTYNSSGSVLAKGIIPATAIVTKDSITYNVEMLDNVISSTAAGAQIVNGYQMIQNKYTDEVGELSRATFDFGYLKTSSAATVKNVTTGSYSSSILSYDTQKFEFKGLKDGREILAMNVHFDIINDDEEKIIWLGDPTDIFTTENIYMSLEKNGRNKVLLSKPTYRLANWQVSSDDIYIYVGEKTTPTLQLKGCYRKYILFTLEKGK